MYLCSHISAPLHPSKPAITHAHAQTLTQRHSPFTHHVDFHEIYYKVRYSDGDEEQYWRGEITTLFCVDVKM